MGRVCTGRIVARVRHIACFFAEARLCATHAQLGGLRVVRCVQQGDWHAFHVRLFPACLVGLHGTISWLSWWRAGCVWGFPPHAIDGTGLLCTWVGGCCVSHCNANMIGCMDGWVGGQQSYGQATMSGQQPQGLARSVWMDQ